MWRLPKCAPRVPFSQGGQNRHDKAISTQSVFPWQRRSGYLSARLMGLQLVTKIVDWDKHVPVGLKGMWQRVVAVELNDSASPNRWCSIHTRVIKPFYGRRSWFFPPKEIWMWHRIFGSICIVLPACVLLTVDFDVHFFVLLLLRNAANMCQKVQFLSHLSIEHCSRSTSGYSLANLRLFF